MCRSIKTLRQPTHSPAPSDADIRAAALQYVRKISGCRAPSRANAPAFHRAIDDIAAASRLLLDSLATR